MTQVGVKAAVALTCVLLGMAVPAAADTVDVAAVGLTFQPPDVIINEGDSVHWTGLSGGFHTVAEVDDAAALSWNGGFHSPAAASEFTFTFTAPGLFHYICEPHVLAGMRGTVTVNEVAVVGACCLSFGCFVLTQNVCELNAGDYMGDDVACSPDPCPVPCDLLGDVNGDGLVRGDDIPGYIRAKLGLPPLTGENQTCADYGSGTIAGDNALFVNDLLN